MSAFDNPMRDSSDDDNEDGDGDEMIKWQLGHESRAAKRRYALACLHPRLLSDERARVL